MKQKWYLKTWIICILFALWFACGIPLLLGILLLVLKNKQDKENSIMYETLISDNEKYKQLLTPEMQDAFQLQKMVEDLHREEDLTNQKILESKLTITTLDEEISAKKKNLVSLDEEILVQEFGLYKPQFDFASALDYKEELAKVRARQKELIKNKTAVTGNNDWTVNGNKAKGKKNGIGHSKIIIACFQYRM